MARIPLRSYNREIENLIDRGQIEEAIAHSKNILKQFPKHIETYRLLGKAYLESQRYSEASDILQRLLSVVPDDFVSQLGMSVIREDEGNLDAAIWHMERAYEVQPFNRAIQDELRRLYGRRDGAEPPRIRLTRGSLVRMYARGDLYSQAIAETRAALAEDHQRLDLQALLAQMYYLSGQKVEAAEIASSLIGKLPYCLEANRILMDILPATSRSEEAHVFQHRVYDLDPYTEFVTPNTPTSAQVPEQAVMVERVDWQPTMQESQSPDWTRTIGVKWEEEKEENLPDWLNTFGKPQTTPSPSAIVPAQQQEVIPDFMREAGWSQSEHAEEPPSTPIAEEPIPAANEDELEQVDIPDWLKEMAPKSVQTESTPDDNRLDWLDSIIPTAGAAAFTAADGPAEIAQQAEQPAAAVEPVDQGIQETPTSAATEPTPAVESQAQASPDFLAFLHQTPAAENAAPEDESLDWLKGFENLDQTPAAAEAPVAPDQAKPVPEAEPPSWLTTSEPAAGDNFAWVQADQPSDAQPEEDLPAWLSNEVQENQTPAEELPAWLNESPAAPLLEQPATESAEWISEPLSVEPEAVQPTEATSQDSLSDWLEELKNKDEGIQPVQTAGIEPVQEPEIPGWQPSLEAPGSEPAVAEQDQPIQAAVPVETPTLIPEPVSETPIPTPAEEPTHPEPVATGSQEMDLDSAMAWLEALAAKQGADEGSLKITAPELRSETPPDWISGYTQVAPSEDAATLPKVEVELPATLEAEPSQESTPEPAAESLTVTPPVVETPLAQAEPPVLTPETIQTGIPVVETPLAQAEPVLSPETVQAGVPAVETPPEAVQPILEPESVFPPEPGEPPAEEKTQPNAVRKEIEPEAALETAPEPAVASEPHLDDIDAAMAWMEALAAKQGADAESLKITSLEERSETPPEWIASLSAAETQPVKTETTPPEGVQEEPVIPTWMAEEEPVGQMKEPELATPVDEIPDWLKGLDVEEKTQQPAAEGSQPISTEPEAIPDWMAEAAPTAEAAEPASAWVAEPEATTEQPETISDTQPPSTVAPDQDVESAMAWLEALASKQGADEGSLKITSPEQRSETPPDWISELAREPVEPALEPEPEPAEASLSTIQESPAVLETAPAEPVIEPAPSASTPLTQEPAETEIPFWLLNYEQEQNQKAKIWETPETVKPEPVQASAGDDSITVWLQSHHPDTGELKTPTPEEKVPAPEVKPELSLAGERQRTPLADAQAAIAGGNIQAAIQHYNQMIQAGENLDDVVEDLRKASLKHPNEVDIWQTLGDAHIRANRIQDALDAYTKAEELLR